MRLLMFGGLAVALFAGCGHGDDTTVAPDAAAIVDAERFQDAPYQCQPLVPPLPGPACLALAAAPLQGMTVFGDLDLDLDSMSAGDCVTISAANITWRGACGETLRLQFPYPVHVGPDSKRVVDSDFDANARFTFEVPNASTLMDTTTVHVAVTTWQEGDGVHDIDITVTITDSAYAVGPLHVQGTFCDWPFYVC